ncbi:MAG: hypothetical protein V1662_03230, partial [Candidatus Omnitrophota bacterium]
NDWCTEWFYIRRLPNEMTGKILEEADLLGDERAREVMELLADQGIPEKVYQRLLPEYIRRVQKVQEQDAQSRYVWLFWGNLIELLRKEGVVDKENIAIALQLVAGKAEAFPAKNIRDEYSEAVLKFVQHVITDKQTLEKTFILFTMVSACAGNKWAYLLLEQLAEKKVIVSAADIDKLNNFFRGKAESSRQTLARTLRWLGLTNSDRRDSLEEMFIRAEEYMAQDQLCYWSLLKAELLADNTPEGINNLLLDLSFKVRSMEQFKAFIVFVAAMKDSAFVPIFRKQGLIELIINADTYARFYYNLNTWLPELANLALVCLKADKRVRENVFHPDVIKVLLLYDDLEKIQKLSGFIGTLIEEKLSVRVTKPDVLAPFLTSGSLRDLLILTRAVQRQGYNAVLIHPRVLKALADRKSEGRGTDLIKILRFVKSVTRKKLTPGLLRPDVLTRLIKDGDCSCFAEVTRLVEAGISADYKDSDLIKAIAQNAQEQSADALKMLLYLTETAQGAGLEGKLTKDVLKRLAIMAGKYSGELFKILKRLIEKQILRADNFEPGLQSIQSFVRIRGKLRQDFAQSSFYLLLGRLFDEVLTDEPAWQKFSPVLTCLKDIEDDYSFALLCESLMKIIPYQPCGPDAPGKLIIFLKQLIGKHPEYIKEIGDRIIAMRTWEDSIIYIELLSLIVSIVSDVSELRQTLEKLRNVLFFTIDCNYGLGLGFFKELTACISFRPVMYYAGIYYLEEYIARNQLNSGILNARFLLDVCSRTKENEGERKIGSTNVELAFRELKRLAKIITGLRWADFDFPVDWLTEMIEDKEGPQDEDVVTLFQEINNFFREKDENGITSYNVRVRLKQYLCEFLFKLVCAKMYLSRVSIKEAAELLNLTEDKAAMYLSMMRKEKKSGLRRLCGIIESSSPLSSANSIYWALLIGLKGNYSFSFIEAYNKTVEKISLPNQVEVGSQMRRESNGSRERKCSQLYRDGSGYGVRPPQFTINRFFEKKSQKWRPEPHGF